MKKTIIRATRVKKHFFSPLKVELLREISLELEEGSSVAIMGKSGEGKSTLLHILGTLEKPTSGEIEICGQLTHEVCPNHLRNEQIGFIFQSYNLLDQYTTLENILMPAKIARKSTGVGSASYVRALRLLEQLELSSRAHFLAKQLSGGEKQRTAIARALCNNPALILADEPSGNLDYAQSHLIHKLLLSLTKQYQKTLIVVTHDKELASLCDRIYILKDGCLCEIQSIDKA